MMNFLRIFTTLLKPLTTTPLVPAMLSMTMAFLLTMFLSLFQTNWLTLSPLIMHISGSLMMLMFFLPIQPNQPFKAMLLMMSILTNTLLFYQIDPGGQMMYSMLTSPVNDDNITNTMFAVTTW